MKNIKENKKYQEERKQKLVQEVLEDFARRQAERRSFETTWQININFLLGNQYCSVGYGGSVEDMDKQYFWQEREVFNHIAPLYDVRYAKLTKIKPIMSVVPATTDERDIKTAKVSQKILSAVGNKLNINGLVCDALKWSETCGTSFYKIVWSKDLGQIVGLDENSGKIKSGDVEISVCSPFEIYPDSPACENLQQCQSVIHAKAYSIFDIKNMYGVEVEGQSIKTYSQSVAPTSGLGYNSTAFAYGTEYKQNCAMVIERYERPSVDFPNGRLLIVAGDKLVYEGDLPYINGKDGLRDFPFVRQVSIETPGCFWGSSVIERLVPIQRAYNTVKNRKHEFINRISLGILSVEDGSVDIDNLEDEGLCPGKVLVYRQGANQPEYLNAQSVPSGISDEEDKLLQEFSQISGVSEFLNFTNLSTNMSGIALELLISQDETRLNSSVESLKNAIKAIGQHILRLYKQFALFPRLAKIVGDNGNLEMFYFSSSDVSSDDIVIDSTNELGESVTQRREMLFRLLDNGILSDDSGKVSSRMKAKFLEMLGFGTWENGQDIAQLQQARADEENLKLLDGVNVKTSEIDDDKIHYSTHVAFMLSQDFQTKKAKNERLEELFLEHIRAHKAKIQEN